jgi:hypothetical protein
MESPLTKLYYQTQPRVNHLCIFGSVCYLHIPKELHSKLDNRTQRCFFLGYDDQTKAFHVFDPIYQKIHISKDIVFDEQKVGYNLVLQSDLSHPEPLFFLVTEPDSDNQHTSSDVVASSSHSDTLPTPPLSLISTTNDHLHPTSSNIPDPQPNYIQIHLPKRSYPTRNHRPNRKFQDYYLFNVEQTPPNLEFIAEPRHF